MDDTTIKSIRLSRDELQVILRLLEADQLPGLDRDLEPWTTAERAIAHKVAARSLQARGLLLTTGNGETRIERDLLNAVGVCVYSEFSLTAFHWETEQELPQRFFGHGYDKYIVAHTRPTELQHEFQLYPSCGAMLSQLLDLAQYKPNTTPEVTAFELPSATFHQMRQLVQAGQTNEAIQVVKPFANGASQALVTTFAQQPRLTMFQSQRNDVTTKQTTTRDFILCQAQSHTWLVVAEDNRTDTNLVVSPTDRTEVAALVEKWLVGDK